MHYKIISTSQNEETITTKVEYHFGETIVEVDIPHFMPESVAVITLGIENRYQSELRKLEATALNSTLIGAIEVGIVKSI